MLKDSRRVPPRRKTAKVPPPKKPGKSPSLIGTRKESSLHRSLKLHYSGSRGKTEIMAGNYICDGKTGRGELIEVQTGSFGPLKEKVKNLTLSSKVRIIHPVLVQKFIELHGVEGTLLYRRKSPKKGSPWDLFTVLVYAPELPLLKNLTIELALVDVAEERVDDGKGSWRRRGVRIADRRLDAWHDSIVLRRPKDYYRFIPFAAGEAFTLREFREKAGINETIAMRTLYVLIKMNLVGRTEKRGRAWVYVRLG